MNILKSMGAVALTALLLSSCGTVPITGRRTLNLLSDGEVLAMSQQQYASFVGEARTKGMLVNNDRVTTIARRLISATEAYMRQSNMTDQLSSMRWEVNTVRSNQVNAFCMPGGKIVVYTGLVNLVGNGAGSDAELAAVIGHEIAHALARHSSERLSNQMLQNLGGQLLGSAVGSQSALLQTVLTQAYGLGTNAFVALPFGRKQEYEADTMGLVLMALAGYNPSHAVSLWQKMERHSGGVQNEFWSTHPSEANRIAKIQAYLPEAMKYYRPQQTPTVSSSSNASKSTTVKRTTSGRRR